MLILGIESSCDETAAAVVRDGRVLLSNIIASQIKVHRKYGGVVPELASRKHIEAIGIVIVQALKEAGVSLNEIEGIAATRGPGLVGALLVGLSTAKAIAYATGLPLAGVNHLAGHVASVFLAEGAAPAFPFIALVVSGGHTHIYRVESLHRIATLAQTRDDAAGEAFDKAAKLLDIGYPGGVIIDRLAKLGDRQAIAFPRPMRDSLDFSFSGLKTALLNMLKRRERPLEQEEIPDVVASFQEAIVDVLVEKTVRAARESVMERVVICGGVAANSRLRERFYEAGQAAGLEIFIPPPVLCTDNAAMIAVVGQDFFQSGKRDRLDLNAVSRWPLDLLRI